MHPKARYAALVRRQTKALHRRTGVPAS
jgi:hypothetical protein